VGQVGWVGGWVGWCTCECERESIADRLRLASLRGRLLLLRCVRGGVGCVRAGVRAHVFVKERVLLAVVVERVFKGGWCCQGVCG